MAYIAPNSDVYILKGVPLDSGYNHTAYFQTDTAQYNALIAYRKYTLNNQSYQRAGKGKIRVALLADNLYDCNYIMFRNTSYGNKWFYAFIDSVDYINDNASEINYTIDVMQTWNFDYTLGDCFVEREHSSTDNVGDNLVPENLEIGSLITNKTDVISYPKMLAGIITKKALPTYYNFGKDQSYIIRTQFINTSSQAPAGVPLGLYLAYGFPISESDANYWDKHLSSYSMQDTRQYHQDHTTPYDSSLNLVHLSIGNLLRKIGDGDFDKMSIDDVVNVYIYPAELNLTDNISRAKNSGFRAGMAADAMIMSRPLSFKDSSNDTSPYYPKNNKMFTYPYMQLELSNQMGNTATYRYEDFINGSKPGFIWVGNFTSSPAILCLPSNHKGIAKDYDSGVILTNFPVPAYEGSQYASWLEQNRQSVSTSMLTSAVSSIPAISMGVASGNVPMMVAGGISLFSSVAKTMAKIEDVKNAPPQIQGQIICDSLNTGLNRTGYKFYHLTIRKEFAEMIDNYFSMFGYACRKVKIPNIRNSNAHKRTKWNYVKTSGCVIHPATNKGLPADDENKIAEIYNNGITFWTTLSDIGNYDQSNPIET